MASHLRPSRSKARALGVLAVAIGIGLLVLVVFEQRSDDGEVTQVRPAAELTSEPTVLGEVVEGSSTLAVAPPASPATFPAPSESDDDDDGSTGGTSSPTRPPG